MRITYDKAKREITLATRELDFADAPLVLRSPRLVIEDVRKDYGEHRYICYGTLRGRMVVVGYTLHADSYRIFSMRKANEREQTRYARLLR